MEGRDVNCLIWIQIVSELRAIIIACFLLDFPYVSSGSPNPDIVPYVQIVSQNSRLVSISLIRRVGGFSYLLETFHMNQERSSFVTFPNLHKPPKRFQ